MTSVSLALGRFTRARIVGAARPHTPRLHSPPQEADAGPGSPRRRNPLSLRKHNDGHQTTRRITKEIGQHDQERYSSQPGGFIFDAHLAQFSVAVSRGIPTRAKSLQRSSVSNADPTSTVMLCCGSFHFAETVPKSSGCSVCGSTRPTNQVSTGTVFLSAVSSVTSGGQPTK